MQFYFEKFKDYRKQTGITNIAFCKKLNIGRTTMWKWENGALIPRVDDIRKIAKILNISVSDISDLEDKIDISKAHGVLPFHFKSNLCENKKQLDSITNYIKSLDFKLNTANMVIDSILGSINSIIYIKDASLRYVAGSKKFYEELGLSLKFDISGKSDADILSLNEAKKNAFEDENVFNLAKPQINQEGFIIGSKKKKVGLVSKYPLLGNDNKIIGVICHIYDITDLKREAEESKLLKHLFDVSDNAVFIIKEAEYGEAYDYLFISKSVEKIYGYKPDVFYNDKNFWIKNCIHPDDLASVLKYREKNEFPLPYIHRILTFDKQVKWIIKRVVKIGDYNICIESDCTNTIRAEADKALLINAIDNLNSYLSIHDLVNKSIIYVNKAWTDYFKECKISYSTLTEAFRLIDFGYECNFNTFEKTFFNVNYLETGDNYFKLKICGTERRVHSNFSSVIKNKFTNDIYRIVISHDLVKDSKIDFLSHVNELFLNMNDSTIFVNLESSKIHFDNNKLFDICELTIGDYDNLFKIVSCVDPAENGKKVLSVPEDYSYSAYLKNGKIKTLKTVRSKLFYGGIEFYMILTKEII